MAKIEPKPCPFCGYVGTLKIVGLPLTEKSVALQIECICGASGPTANMSLTRAQSGAGKSDAMKKWNQRVTDAD